MNVRPRLRSLRIAALAAGSSLALHAAALAQTSAGAVTPMYGNINAFYGNISAFYGNLNAFYGNLSPFYGNLAPFYGNLSPFYGNLSAFWGGTTPFTPNTSAAVVAAYGPGYDAFWGGGNANPYTHNPSPQVNYSQIAGFWTQESASWSKVQAAWAQAHTSGDYTSVATLLQTTILAPAGSFWGAAIAANPGVVTPTAPIGPGSGGPGAGSPGGPGGPLGGNSGKGNATTTLQSQLLKPFLDAGGALNADGSINAASLANISPTEQNLLFLTLYDTLMSYAGTGHVDWWMGSAHWSPALAAIATSGISPSNPITVGMLDFTVTNNQKNAKGSLLQYGSNVFSNGHGAAVGSLIIGSIDGSGVMGVMPSGTGRVIVYDPYDATNTTNWADVATGIKVLANSTFNKNGAPTGVLNASLGVPGWTLNPGWNDALSSGAAKGHNLVIAAGNDGITQTTNVPWNFATNPNLIIVGSVGVDGTISNFSNRPGEACLLSVADASQSCVEANKLKYRFIVAPGELVLVSDGNGGLMRQSGTSLAAPLVSGAIALLQARWPWLANYPDETAQIILKSATPLGANPGADATYGVGELNIQASQSPLNWSKLQYYPVTNGKVSATAVSAASIVTTVSTGSPASWNASKLAITAIEPIGATIRDFQIPLASSLVGQNAPRSSGTGAYQAYLTNDLKSWVAGGGKFAAGPAQGAGYASFMASSAPVGTVMGMDLRLATTPRETPFGFLAPQQLDRNVDMALIGGRTAFRFGVGDGGSALNGGDGTDQRSDLAARRGGANPLLSLASGGAFFDGRLAASERLTVSIGATSRRDARDLSLYGVTPNNPARVYAADAERIGLDYVAGDRLTLHGGVLRLREASGLLGFQSVDPTQLGGGATTTAATFGFDWALGKGLLLTGTGTVAHTASAHDQALTTGPGGVDSTAAELALSKTGVFAAQDRLRLAVSKPLQAYQGELHFASYGVVDRQTGALGVIDQSAQAGDGRTPWAVEALYGRLLPSRAAEISGFVRTEANTDNSVGSAVTYVLGARYKVHF